MDLNQRIIELEKENKYLKEELRKRGFVFNNAIKAKKVRELGIFFLQEAMKLNKHLSFESFDRMFPNQKRIWKFDCFTITI